MLRLARPSLVQTALGVFVAAVLATGGVLALSTLHPARAGNHMRIVVVFKSTDPRIVFWQIVRAGVDSAAREFGVAVRVVGPREEKDVGAQIAMIERIIREHPAAIVLAADDGDALLPVAKQIRRAGIALVTIDSGLNGNLSSSFIATDNVRAAGKAAELTASLLNGEGSVALVSYVKGTTTAIQREKGVEEVLDSYPGIRILGTYYSQDLTAEAYAITRRLLSGRRPPNALITLNEVATVGAARAVADLHDSRKVALIGFDNSPAETTYLEAGVIKGIVLQKPFNIGYLGVAEAVRLLNGERVDRRIDTGSLLVTKATMYDRESQKLLFPLVDGSR